MHRNKAKLAHSCDTIVTQVETIADEEGKTLGISFGNRDDQTTVLDFETDWQAKSETTYMVESVIDPVKRNNITHDIRKASLP